MTPDLYRIPGPWSGRLAIAARPRGGDWLADELRGWRDAGVDVMVSLLEPDEAVQLDLSEEAASAKINGIHFISFPIPDRGVPISGQAAAELITAISEELGHGRNVAVHCRQGVGRSGLIAAAVLANAGARPENAVQIVSSARGQAIPETAAQRLWIEQFASRPPVPAV